jgi:hypothetical protein
MLFKLAAVVFVAAIAVFFAQEFIRLFKRVFEIKGALLVLPLALASYLVYALEAWVHLGLLYYRDHLLKGLSFLLSFLPAQNWVYPVLVVLLLTFVSVAPVLAWDFYSLKKTHKHYPYPYVTSTIVWLVSALVLLV